MDFRHLGIVCIYFMSSAFAYAQESGEPKINIDNGLRVSSSDGANSILVGGYVLFDAIPLDDNNTRSPRFDVFNAWIFFVGRVGQDFDYKIQYALDDTTANKLRDAFIGYRFSDSAAIRLGHFDVPTYAEHVSALTYTTFAGRSMLDSLTAGRDVGIALYGNIFDSRWFYTAGVFNGNGIDANGEDNGAKDIGARLTGRLLGATDTDAFRVYPDISMSGGQQNGDSLRVKSESGTAIFASSLPVEQSYRAAACVYAMMGSLTLRAEYLSNHYIFSNTDEAATVDGASITAAYYLSGESEQYRDGLFQKTKPLRPFRQADGLGAWQIAARYSRIHASSAMVEQLTLAADKNRLADAAGAQAATIGVNWLPHQNARVNLSVIHTRFDRLAASALGRSENAAIMRATLQFF